MFGIIFYVVCILVSLLVTVSFFKDGYMYYGFLGLICILLCLVMIFYLITICLI